MLERLCFVLIHYFSTQVQHHFDQHDLLYTQPQRPTLPPTADMPLWP